LIIDDVHIQYDVLDHNIAKQQNCCEFVQSHTNENIKMCGVKVVIIIG